MDKFKWDLSKIYKDDKDIEKDKLEILKIIDEVEELKKEPFDNLLKIIELLELSMRKISKLFSYSNMKRDEDSRISKYQKMALEIDMLYTKLSTSFSFFQPFILSLSDEKLNEINTDVRFEPYRKHIDRILRYKKHTLSEKEETILSKVGEMASDSSNNFYMLSYADMKFPKLEKDNTVLTHANYTDKMSSSDRELRKEAFDKMYGTYDKYKNTFGSTLYNNIRNLVIEANLRGYNSAREMELYDDAINTNVYDNLIYIVHKYLDYLYDYYKIRERLLNIDETHMYDVYANVVNGYDKEIPYEEAQEIVLKAVEPMGAEYVSIMKKAFKENWIDVYPREGKKSGAYSGGCYDSSPYILLNYTDNLESVFTLIHELGHSIHSYYSRENNDFLYSNYTIFVAEVASTFNELLLLNYLIENSKDDREEIYLINHYLNSYKSTVFRQTMFAEFERETHKLVEEGNALTQEDFSEIYYNLNKKYFGPDVVIDKEIELEWARIPHFYRNFYVYKYATGFLCATILSQQVLSNKPNALNNYLNFLKDGSNNYPLVQLRKAGCDMEDMDNLDKAFKVFVDLVKDFDNLTSN